MDTNKRQLIRRAVDQTTGWMDSNALSEYQRTLTFEERVSYQRAIEEVYWRHRIWSKKRP